MPYFDLLTALSETDLLRLHGAVIEELVERKVVTTRNNPIGDYTEWLVAKTLGLTLEANSKAGFDATCKDGVRYQIKGRRILNESDKAQLSAIRNLEHKDFDWLIAVVFDANYQVIEVLKVSHATVCRHAVFGAHTNSHILHARGSVASDSEVESLLDSFGPQPVDEPKSHKSD